MAEHYRPALGKGKHQGGYAQGYYCLRCGASGLAMQGNRKHGSGICLSNPIMVKILNEANTVEAETKRKFVDGLKHGKPDEMPEADWEYIVGGRKKK